MQGRKRSLSGFTLIELLVVISIIGLLIAVLLPALSAARKTARSMQCMANLRSMGLAVHGYATDHQDQLPAAIMEENGPFEVFYWFNNLNNYYSGAQNNRAEQRADGSIDDFELATRCPNAVIEAGSVTYAPNPAVAPNRTGANKQKALIRLAQMKRLSEIIAAADAGQASDSSHVGSYGDASAALWGIDYSGTGVNPAESTPFNPSNPVINDPILAGPNSDVRIPGLAAGPTNGWANIRWRENSSEEGGATQGDVGGKFIANFLFLDGRVEPRSPGDILTRNVRRDG